MKHNRTMRTLIGVMILLTGVILLQGCASGPEVQNYPISAIDRPYTLPKGVALWNVGMFASFRNLNPNAATGVDMSWQQSLSDNWNLLWDPLPLTLLYQISKSESDIWGLRFGIGYGYSSVSGSAFQPGVGFYNRHYLNKNLALVSDFSYSTVIRSATSDRAWAAELSLGPLLELNETASLHPYLLISDQDGYQYFYADNENLSSETFKGQHFTFPLGVVYQHNLSRNWDLNISYEYQGLGQRNNYSAHNVGVSGKYFW